MVFGAKYRRYWFLMMVGGVLLAGNIACQEKASKLQLRENDSLARRSALNTVLADVDAELPEGIRLPVGFYPLQGQYDLGNPDGHYNGWPRYIVCEHDNMIMAYVPSQRFSMGGGIDLDEVPARNVLVNHFYMDLHEVSNEQFDRFCKSILAARERASSSCWDPCGLFSKPRHPYNSNDRPWVEPQATQLYACNDQQPGGLLLSETNIDLGCHDQLPTDLDYYMVYFKPGLNNHHPARNVSWWEAWYYAKWTQKMLPTEAQWEAAARGGDRRIYPWGNDQESELTRYLCNARTGMGNFDGYEYTAPVLNYSAGVSPYGVFNMAGNVWEWCSDWYDPGRYAYPSCEDPATGLQRGEKAFGDRNYPNPPAKILRPERVGPIAGGQRAIRGGSFADPIENCRVDARRAAKPNVHQQNVGFRCILPLPPDESITGG